MKQVIVVRKDLKMRRGKECCQVAHASVKSVVNCYPDQVQKNNVNDWLLDGMSKIVVGCNSEDELYQIMGKAKELEVAYYLIQDAGLTEVEPGTATVVAIGPDEDHKVDAVTSHLKLL